MKIIMPKFYKSKRFYLYFLNSFPILRTKDVEAQILQEKALHSQMISYWTNLKMKDLPALLSYSKRSANQDQW